MTTNNATPRGTEMFNKRMKWLNGFMGSAEERHINYVKQDPNQYFKIDKPNYYKAMVKQYETGKATGTCFQDHTKEYIMLYVNGLTGKNTLDDYKFVWYEFNNPSAGETHIGCHAFLIVKINNVWYARDKTNHIEEQRCLLEYFRDRRNMNIFGVWEVGVKVKAMGNCEEGSQYKVIMPSANERKNKPINMDHYWGHNIIVNTLRGTTTYSQTPIYSQRHK